MQTDFSLQNLTLLGKEGSTNTTTNLLGQYLPKKTDFNLINNNTINMIISKLNNRPRKLLGYRTPNEVFFN